MPTPKPRKKLRPRGPAGVKRSASCGRGKKWTLVLLVVLLLIPAMQVAVVRFINPPLTLPMLIDQGGAMFSSGLKHPLRFFHCEVHLLPVKALVLKESLIFRNPEVLQEHLRNVRQRDPAVAEWTLWPAQEHRAALVDQHR